MNGAEDKAREILGKNIELVRVDVSSIKDWIYEPARLKNCDIFRFKLYSSFKIGAESYIALPHDGSPPYFLGEIGE